MPRIITTIKLSEVERDRLRWLGERIARDTGASEPVPMGEVIRRMLNAEFDRYQKTSGKNRK